MTWLSTQALPLYVALKKSVINATGIAIIPVRQESPQEKKDCMLIAWVLFKIWEFSHSGLKLYS